MAEESVRHLQNDARAVARQRIATGGAAMDEVEQDIDALLTISCEASPLMLATKPTPQASCSNFGS